MIIMTYYGKSCMTVCHGVATDFVTCDYGSKCIATKRIKTGLTFLFEIAQFLTDIYNRSWLSFFITHTLIGS